MPSGLASRKFTRWSSPRAGGLSNWRPATHTSAQNLLPVPPGQQEHAGYVRRQGSCDRRRTLTRVVGQQLASMGLRSRPSLTTSDQGPRLGAVGNAGGDVGRPCGSPSRADSGTGRGCRLREGQEGPTLSASAVLQQTNKENSQCLTGGYWPLLWPGLSLVL